MKKMFDLPVVELVAFQSEDIICTSTGGFFGEEDSLENVGTGGGGITLPPIWN